jgi:hypothetical protein
MGASMHRRFSEFEPTIELGPEFSRDEEATDPKRTCGSQIVCGDHTTLLPRHRCLLALDLVTRPPGYRHLSPIEAPGADLGSTTLELRLGADAYVKHMLITR